MRKDTLMEYFILTYVFIICTAPRFFLWICVAFWLSFPEGLLSFSISCKTDLLATNLLSLCLSENAFILPSFLKNGFVRYRILI